MSFAVAFYKFNKRKNSTKQPPENADAVYNCDIWGDCEMSSPTLSIKADSGFITRYTYAVIGLWGKAYFIRDYAWRGNFITVDLEEDVLGTYKQFIVDRPQYISRSTVNYDTSVIDSVYPSTTNITTIEVLGGIPKFFSKAGTYMLSIIGAEGLAYYAVPYSTLTNIMRSMFTSKQDNLWEQIVNIAETDLTRNFINPISYIKGAYWIPIAFDVGSPSQIYYGFWDSGFAGSKAYPPERKEGEVTLTCKTNPNASGTKDFLKMPPFSRGRLYLPYCGMYTLDMAVLTKTSSIKIKYVCDCLGNLSCEVSTATGTLLLHVTGNCCTELVLGSGGAGFVRSAQGISSIASGIIAKDVTTIGSGIGYATDGLSGSIVTTGSPGGYSDIDFLTPRLVYDFMDITTPSSQPPGHPCCKTLSPSTNGWYQCRDAQIDWCDESVEFDITKEYMDNGFWVE